MSRRLIVLLTLIVLSPSLLAAQDAKPSPPPVTAGWRDGFFIQSDKGDFRLQIGALVHADGRFAPGDEDEAVTDTFAIRRLRPYLRGRFAQHFEFYFNPDFAGGTLVVQDAYVDTVFSPAFRIRAGKGKTPFGLERLQSASNMLFFERALPTALVPNRDVGVQVLGDISGGLVSYLAGVMNGVPTAAAPMSTRTTARISPGRLVVRPFTKRPTSPLRGLGARTRRHPTGKQAGAGALADAPHARRCSSRSSRTAAPSPTASAPATRRRSPTYYKAFGGLPSTCTARLPVRKGAVRDDIAPRRLADRRLVRADRRGGDRRGDRRPPARELRFRRRTLRRVPDRRPLSRADGRRRAPSRSDLAAPGSSREGRGVDGRSELVPHAAISSTSSTSSAPCSTTMRTGRARPRTRSSFRTQVNF